MTEEKKRLRIVARTDAADLLPEPTDLSEKLRRMMDLAFQHARMKVRSVDGGRS